jgi:(2R)-sulfolactate sulfo-lyase subunit alpha
MTTTKKIAQVILLHPNDNILVCVAHIYTGDVIDIDGRAVSLGHDIEVGHKLARRAMKAGDKIYRYGAPIGSMTQAVAIGEHVHMHNMQSDYIPSHTRTRQNKDRSES